MEPDGRSRYGEYCPIAVGAELFGDRWIPLIIRELMLGSTRFNEIHRGMPSISRSVLAQRLRSLERRGIVTRTDHGQGRRGEYILTAAGRELEPIVWALGRWASRWSYGDPAAADLDASWLIWRLHQHVDFDETPPGRTVVEIRLTGPGGGRGWLVIDRGGSTACQVDPGYDVDLIVTADARFFNLWFNGLADFADGLRTGAVQCQGRSSLTHAFPGWFREMTFVSHIRWGREQRVVPGQDRPAENGDPNRDDRSPV